MISSRIFECSNEYLISSSFEKFVEINEVICIKKEKIDLIDYLMLFLDKSIDEKLNLMKNFIKILKGIFESVFGFEVE